MNAHLSVPAETPLGEYVEAAIYALRADRPDVALGYLIQGATLSGHVGLTVSAHRAGASNE